MGAWLPFETAPKIKGYRVLAWCRAADSRHGIAEYVWNGEYWEPVIDHPCRNACMNPTYWMPSIEEPKP